MTRKRYTVTIRPRAVKAMTGFPWPVQERMQKTIGSLFDDPRPKHHECRKIGKNTYRIKVGQDYRVIYTIDDTAKEVEIFRVAHRKDAY